MDKSKIVHAAREAISKDNARESSGDKSLIGDVVGAFINAVTDATPNRRPEKDGKLSGQKPKAPTGMAAVGKKISEQIKSGKK